jgi:hypothetical protein
LQQGDLLGRGAARRLELRADARTFLSSGDEIVLERRKRGLPLRENRPELCRAAVLEEAP